MKSPLKLIVVIASALAIQTAPAQQMRTTTMYTTGTGSSTNADQAQSTSDATQTATNWANASCIGTVTNTSVTFSQCSPLTAGGQTQYFCSVTVQATCQVQSRQ